MLNGTLLPGLIFSVLFVQEKLNRQKFNCRYVISKAKSEV
jgi:hypothetical protein